MKFRTHLYICMYVQSACQYLSENNIKDAKEEQNKIKDDIKQKSKDFTNKIENIIAELFEIISNYKNKISIFEEKFKNSTINLNILYKNFYEDLQNTRDEDYLNLYLLSKLHDDYGRINLTKQYKIFGLRLFFFIFFLFSPFKI